MTTTLDRSTIRPTILAEMVRIGEQQGKTLPPLSDDLPLLDTGLDSLCLAILVATLDDLLALDPFSGDGPAVFPVTVSDFIAAYEHAAAA
jgi:hypothetical protein